MDRRDVVGEPLVVEGDHRVLLGREKFPGVARDLTEEDGRPLWAGADDADMPGRHTRAPWDKCLERTGPGQPLGRRDRAVQSFVPSPFESLGLSARFDLTPGTIERAYLARIAGLHPDLAGAGSEQSDQNRAAATLNDAKATLLDDELRAEALLAILGGPGKSEDKSLPPGFLMEMMEVRETVEADLLADAPAARVRWREWADKRKAEHRVSLAAMFTSPTIPLKAVRVTLNQWRYVERLIEQL